MSLTDRDARQVRVTAEKVHDRRGGLFGRWVKGRLLLFDLGYCAHDLLRSIMGHGGDFVTRLKVTSNGDIVAVRRGCARRHVGERYLQDIYRGSLVDIDVRFGEGSKAMTLRVVGSWNGEADRYHWYVTTLSAEEYDGEWVAEVYRLRWQVELLIKSWKSLCRMDRMPSADPAIVECMVHAALCASLLSTICLKLAARRFGIPWHETCSSVALKILSHFARQLGRAAVIGRKAKLKPVVDDLLEVLAVHARLPNGTNAVLGYADNGR